MKLFQLLLLFIILISQLLFPVLPASLPGRRSSNLSLLLLSFIMKAFRFSSVGDSSLGSFSSAPQSPKVCWNGPFHVCLHGKAGAAPMPCYPGHEEIPMCLYGGTYCGNSIKADKGTTPILALHRSVGQRVSEEASGTGSGIHRSPYDLVLRQTPSIRREPLDTELIPNSKSRAKHAKRVK
jgi:hypothetical protein